MKNRLERELPRKLKNAWIECGVDLAEIRVVDVERIRHLEVRVIENVESFKSQLETEPFLEPDPLDQRRVHVPVTRTVNWRQTQTSDCTRGWMSKERRARSAL